MWNYPSRIHKKTHNPMSWIHKPKLMRHWSIVPLMIFFLLSFFQNAFSSLQNWAFLSFLVSLNSCWSGPNVVVVSSCFYNFFLIFHLSFVTIDLSKNEGFNKTQLELLNLPQVKYSMFLKLAHLLVLNLQMKERTYELMWLCEFWMLLILLLWSSIFPSKGWHQLWNLGISQC